MRQVRDVIMDAIVLTASANSAAIDTSNLLMVSIQAVVAGTAAGTLKIVASNDASPTNWSDISGATVAIADTGVYFIPKTELSYRWIRLVYTRTSHTGSPTMSVNFNGIGF